MSRTLMVKEDRTFCSWEGPKEADAIIFANPTYMGRVALCCAENYPASAESLQFA
jgi:hypothetical protein